LVQIVVDVLGVVTGDGRICEQACKDGGTGVTKLVEVEG
jgi:hypothetical protein